MQIFQWVEARMTSRGRKTQHLEPRQQVTNNELHFDNQEARLALQQRERFRGECRAPAAWTIPRLEFFKKLDAKLEKGIRGYRAVALRYAAVVVRRRTRAY